MLWAYFLGPSHKSEKLNWKTKLAYGAGDLGPAITSGIGVFFLLYFFFMSLVSCRASGSTADWQCSEWSDCGGVDDALNLAGSPSSLVVIWCDSFGILYFFSGLYHNLVLIHLPKSGVYYVAIGILFNAFYCCEFVPYGTYRTVNSPQDYNERTTLNSFRFLDWWKHPVFDFAQVIFQRSLIPSNSI